MDLEMLTQRAMAGMSGIRRQEPHLVLVGQPPNGTDIEELAQTLRLLFQEAPIFGIMWDRTKFHRRKLLKNGFTDGFLLPFETAPLQRTIKAHLRKITEGRLPSFRAIRVADLTPATVLPFGLSVYLPMNERYVPFHPAGDLLSKDRFDKMISHKMDSVLVNTDELPLFYEYSRGSGLTERRHRLEDEFRTALSNFLRGGEVPLVKESEQFVTDCSSAIRNYVLEFPREKITDQIFSYMGDFEDHYNHALNTATYCAIFSMMLGIGDPEQMGLAGLLHDLGECDLPFEITAKSKESMSEEEFKLYQAHPARTVSMLRELKLPVRSEVLTAIAHHHEQYEGGGYPENRMHFNIPIESQLLAFADRFDYFTRRKSGMPGMSLQESLAVVRRKMLIPEKKPTNPEFVHKVLETLGK
jgi:HD-GYP domain-containing protein (c-di-GMP phosphodiesterase class II)